MEFVMKILFLEWKSYCVPDMAEAFTEAGHDVILATCAEMTDRYNTEFDIFFEKKLASHPMTLYLHLTIFLLCPRTVTRLKFFISPGFMTIH